MTIRNLRLRTALGLLLVTAGSLGVLFLLSLAFPAEALSDPLSLVRVFQFSCTTTAAQIKPTDVPRNAKAMRIWNNSTTPVYLGGSDVTNGLTKGWPICTDTAACEQASFPIDVVANVYCRAGSSTTVQVFFGQ